MSSLVIGAGFLGSEICKILKQNKIDFIPTTTNGREVVDLKSTSLPLNVLDLTSLVKLKPELNIDEVIYCISPQDASPDAYRQTYCEGLKNLISYLKQHLPNVNKFVLTSSTGVFNENKGGWVDEESATLDEHAKYSSLIKAEKLVLTNFPCHGLILRVSGLYGAGRDSHIRSALSQPTKDITADRWTNRIHVTDAARACCHLLKNSAKGPYIISDPTPSLMTETTNFVRTIFHEAPFHYNIASGDLAGKRCRVRKLLSTDFTFLYPSYKEGYRKLLKDSV